MNVKSKGQLIYEVKHLTEINKGLTEACKLAYEEIGKAQADKNICIGDGTLRVKLKQAIAKVENANS